MGEAIELKFSTCGIYKLCFYGKSYGNNEYHSLGNVTVDLPHYEKLIEKEDGQTWVKMGFRRENSTCYPNRTYTVSCGSLVFKKLRKDTDILVNNLLPGSSYSCEYKLDGSPMEKKNASFSALSSRYLKKFPPPFSASDKIISLRQDEEMDLLLNPNISVAITATDSVTNETFRADKMDALRSVSGLKPARKYKACITMGQVESSCTFECRNKTRCFDVTTLPPLSPLLPSGMHWKSMTGVWIVCGFLFLLFSASVIMNFILWMRLDAIGAPTSKLAWIQLKKRAQENPAAREEAAIMKINQENASEN